MTYRNGNLYVPSDKAAQEKEDDQGAKKKSVKRAASDSSERKAPEKVMDNQEKNEVGAFGCD